MATVMTTAERLRRRQHQMQFAQLCVYLVLIGIIIYTWSGFDRRDARICESAQANRDSTKNVVIAIHELGEQLVLGSTDPDSPTPQQQASLDRFEQFKNQQLEMLNSPVCDGKD
jgi:hypothetical protein